MARHTLLDAATIANSKRNMLICSDLKDVSGILATAVASPTNDGIQDIDTLNLALGAGAFRIPNKGVTVTKPQVGNMVTDLFPYSYEDSIDKFVLRKAKMSIQQWIKYLEPSINEGCAQALSGQFTYGTPISANGFKGLRQIAFENGKDRQTYGSGTGSNHTSILIVNWHPRECCVLYDPADMKGLNGKRLLQLFVKNGGNLTTLLDGDGNPFTGYEYGGELPLGLKVMSTERIAVLSGVKDVTNYTPDATDLRWLIKTVHGKSDGKTVIYCNSDGRALLGALMDTKVNFNSNLPTHNLPLFVGTVDQIPVILEDGITTTESRDE